MGGWGVLVWGSRPPPDPHISSRPLGFRRRFYWTAFKLPASILRNNRHFGYGNSLKSQFKVFAFSKTIENKNVFLTKTNRRRLGYHQAEGVGRSKRSPEGSLDEKVGFEDQLLYPELKFGVENEFPMFGKIRCSQNVFLWIRMVFGIHLAMPKPHFAWWN